MQSRQVRLPVIEPLVAVGEVAQRSGVALAHRDGVAPTLALPTVLIGPEGGWDDAELDLSVPHVELAPSVLRAETAAVAAGTVLSLLRARLVLEHSE